MPLFRRVKFNFYFFVSFFLFEIKNIFYFCFKFKFHVKHIINKKK